MLDLFITTLDESKLHPNFKEIIKEKESYARELLLYWTEGFIDRDKKFVKEFQTTFNSSFWELYLFNIFKEYEFTIDFSHSYPDFILVNPFQLAFEAVISNNANNAAPEYNRKYDFDSPELAEIVRTATIRLANAIIHKYKKYKEHYSRLDIIKNKPFVLAVAPFEQPFFWEQTNRAIYRVLYGVEGFEYKDPNNRIAPEVIRCIMNPFIEKDNGSEIPLGFFSDNQMEEISAILFSNVATFGKIRALTKNKDPREMIFFFSRFNKNGFHPEERMLPKAEYEETLDSGLTLYLNPFAKNPLQEDFIKKFPAWNSFDFTSNFPYGDARDGNLINRMVQVINQVY